MNRPCLPQLAQNVLVLPFLSLPRKWGRNGFRSPICRQTGRALLWGESGMGYGDAPFSSLPARGYRNSAGAAFPPFGHALPLFNEPDYAKPVKC
jgi:hypothetical protein